MSEPGTSMSFSDFAASRGWAKSYVTKLRQAGRLVLTPDGRRVRVAESMERITDTRDPSKAGVAARHAAARATQPAAAPVAAPEAEEAPTTPPSAPEPIDSGAVAGKTYQQARAVRERYLAMSAKRDYEISIGRLLEAAAVQSVAASVITEFRVRLDALPPTLAPQLAPLADEAEIISALAAAFDQLLEALASGFTRLAGTQDTAL